jgi:hypothetical protein
LLALVACSSLLVLDAIQDSSVRILAIGMVVLGLLMLAASVVIMVKVIPLKKRVNVLLFESEQNLSVASEGYILT